MQTGTGSLHWVWIGAVRVPLYYMSPFCIFLHSFFSQPNISNIIIDRSILFRVWEKISWDSFASPSSFSKQCCWPGWLWVTLLRWTKGAMADEARWWVRKSCQQYRKRSNPGGPMRSWEKHEKIWENHGGATHFSQKKSCPEKDHAHCFKKMEHRGKIAVNIQELPANKCHKTIGECPRLSKSQSFATSPGICNPAHCSILQLSELSILAKARQSWPRLSRGAAGLLGPLPWAVWNLHLKKLERYVFKVILNILSN